MATREERNAAQRAYYKKWRAENKEKVKQHNQNYWDKKAAELKGKSEN